MKLKKMVRIISVRRQDRNFTKASTILPGIDGPTDQSRRTSTRRLCISAFANARTRGSHFRWSLTARLSVKHNTLVYRECTNGYYTEKIAIDFVSKSDFEPSE